jgi:tetratricopeptide (TPR) repeat protein
VSDDPSFVAGFYHGGPSAEDVVDALALRGALQRAEKAGLQRGVAVALAERLKPEEGLNFTQALIEVEHNVEIAVGVITRGTHGTSDIEGANVVLEKVVERTAIADFDSAVRALDDALVEIDSLEAKQQEASHRKQIIFLEAAIVQHTLRRDVVGVVSRIERLIALDHTANRLASLRARYDEYLVEGDTKGVNFSLLIAAECARRIIELSGQKERGSSLALLAHALSTLGERENGVRHLLEAVEIYRNALVELPHDRAPLHWAIVQNNLGHVLCTIGQREEGTERLLEAVEACREALKERTREHLPLQWAITQNNLGNALSILGERESGTERLLESAEAYRGALEEMTSSPIDRAMTQSNLGNVLSALGEREHGTEHLLESVELYREALKERTRERVPLDWAMTKNNLGNALYVLGTRENSTERLVEAVEVCREALKERTRERTPLYWATTQNNLGNALFALGLSRNNTGLLLEAVEVYREALKERTRERVPLDWAKTQYNLGMALSTLGQRGNSSEHLLEAVGVYREALKERTRERVPLNWAMTQYNLGIALSTLGRRESGIERLHQAIEAYHETLKELTREHTPAEWSKARNALITTQAILNERLGLTSSAPLSFEELKQRQNPDLVSSVTVHDNPVPREPNRPARTAAQSQPRSVLPVPQAGHELTRPELSAAVVTVLAQPRAQSVITLLEHDPAALIRAADEILRKPEQTHPPTRGRPQPGPSRKSKLAEAARLVTGELPPLLARKRVRRKPGKPSLNAEAQRIVSQFQRDHGKVQYDESALEIVKAARVILAQNRPKNQSIKGRIAVQSGTGQPRS